MEIIGITKLALILEILGSYSYFLPSILRIRANISDANDFDFQKTLHLYICYQIIPIALGFLLAVGEG